MDLIEFEVTLCLPMHSTKLHVCSLSCPASMISNEVMIKIKTGELLTPMKAAI